MINPNSQTILIAGSSGLLGMHMTPILLEKGFHVKSHALKGNADFNADISNKDECFELLNKVNPNVILNLVGLTSVELCEEDPDFAYRVNTRSVENIANWITTINSNCHLIQISTDQIYDGLGPHNEDSVKIKNTYAFSKYSGELAASSVNATILRTNFFGKSKVIKRESITDWIFNNITNNIPINVFDDVYFSPLSMDTICDLMPLIIKLKIPGTFNLCSKNGMTKADFDFFFAKILDLDITNMTRIKSEHARQLKAYRPKDMRMEYLKFEKFYGVHLPELTTEIRRVAIEYKR